MARHTFVDEKREQRKKAFKKKVDEETGVAPTPLPGKAPQITPDRGPTRASHAAARAALKRRRAARHEDFNTNLVPEKDRGQKTPKAKKSATSKTKFRTVLTKDGIKRVPIK